MDVKNIDVKYRPIPFWSWNEKLNGAETAEQVSTMNDVGIGGFFMHARGGLQTEYMSDEWFENVEAATAKAEELGMRPWAYDENGWPSGFGSGIVNGKGIEYQQKYLRMEKTLQHTETAICKCGEYYFYYDVNPFYVDTLDKKAIKAFIESTYQPYYERFSNRIEGFFTDEPQISRNGIPWSFVFKDEYQSRYNEDLFEHLDELFVAKGEYKATRIKFWKMVTDLFSESFFKQIYDWCNERGLKLTGHLVIEENLGGQLTTNGACMPHYEYFNIPGMDWLGRNIRECLTPKQVSTVAEQLGKEAVISETFALCGHNVSFAELKGIYEWQMVRGINLLCQHLEGYSIRGMRKRDYPPAMYKQQPWWSDYKKWIDAMSRTGMILAKGKVRCDVLVMHPQTTAWAEFDCGECKGLKETTEKLFAVMKELEEKHIEYHLGDETIMERHAKVENGKLIIGSQAYSYVIDECCDELLPKTKELFDEYRRQGGKFVTASEIKPNDVTDRNDITYTSRHYDDMTVHYFVNTSPDEKYADIKVEGKKLDIYSGELCDFSGRHRFEPWGSLMIFEDGTKNKKAEAVSETPVYLKGEFKLAERPQNAITLDRCDYYFDGVLQEKGGYILNICERANTLERPVKIHMDFKAEIDYVPEKLELICETPEKFVISVNGQTIDTVANGYYVDKSFKRIDISKYVKTGQNTIELDCDFVQSEEVYKNCRNAWKFESEKNKLNYDIEIEALYLLGDFSVRTDGEWTALERNAQRYNGSFVIDKPCDKITLTNIEKQGFPFYCGELKLEGEIEVCGENPVLALERTGINVVKVEVGEINETVLTDDRLDLRGLSKGKHKIKLTLKNNLRNLLGPHHLEEGESYVVAPDSFFKEKCVWLQRGDADWNWEYCLVETSIKTDEN